MNAKTIALCILFFVLPALFCFAQEQGRKESLYQQMEAGGLSVIWVGKGIFQENMIWENGRVYSKNKAPCFAIDVAVIPLEFCILPRWISNLDEIGYIEQYNFTQLDAAKEIEAQKAHIDPKHWRYLSGKPYVMLRENQIMILRQNKKCVAFKPVEVVARDNSWEETPKGSQYSWKALVDKNGRELKEAIKMDTPAAPIWKTIIYEWKVLHSNGRSKTVSAQNYETSQGTSSATFAVYELTLHSQTVRSGNIEFFHIPGVDSAVAFSFAKGWTNYQQKDEKGQNHKKRDCDFGFNAQISTALVKKPWLLDTEEKIENIKDPSSGKFREIPHNVSSSFREVFAFHHGGVMNERCFLSRTRILKLDNRYVAIRPLKVEDRRIFYQWKYWPFVLSAADVLAQKQAKQQADYNEANKKAKVRNSKAPTLRNFYLAGVNFSWEVLEKPQQKNLTLSYEAKIELAEMIEFAFAKENEIKDIEDPSLYAFSASRESHGNTVVNLNQPIVFRIGNKYAAIRPTEIRRNGTKNFVVYQWKHWPNVVPPAELAKTALNK